MKRVLITNNANAGKKKLNILYPFSYTGILLTKNDGILID